MPFHSPWFVLAFLPAVLFGFYLVGRSRNASAALFWLLSCSLAFYALADPRQLWVLGASILGNHALARVLCSLPQTAGRWRIGIVAAGVAANVCFLFSFKALLSPWFATGQTGAAFTAVSGSAVLIPLGLSFITFQQIGYVVDVYRGQVRPGRLLDYSLFVTFFPQMVMGPIVRYRDLAPQFRQAAMLRPDGGNIMSGLSIFAVGLFKKVVLSDNLAPFVDQVFGNAGGGVPVHPADAVLAAIAFAFQLYFDFSAYADMAIGMARMLNVNLPINFHHPYRAVDRFDVWRRWHISFVAFMREYVFHPLVRSLGIPVSLAIMITALLSGLWHGLSWSFVLWGLLTGTAMLVRHAWTGYLRRRRLGNALHLPKAFAIAGTFTITVAMGVLFRSGDIETAGRFFLAPQNGWNADTLLTQHGGGIFVLGLCALVVWGMPCLQELFGPYWRAQDPRPQREVDVISATPWMPQSLQFSPGWRWGLFTGALLAMAILGQGETTRFLYYQF